MLNTNAYLLETASDTATTDGWTFSTFSPAGMGFKQSMAPKKSGTMLRRILEW